MRSTLIALSFLAATTVAAQADEDILRWEGPRTGTVSRGDMPVGYCRETLREQSRTGGKKHLFYYPEECTTPARNSVKLGWQVDGLPVSTKGLKEGRHIKINKKGRIVLFDK